MGEREPASVILARAEAIAAEALSPLPSGPLDAEEVELLRQAVADALEAAARGEVGGCEVEVVEARADAVTVRVTGPAWLVGR